MLIETEEGEVFDKLAIISVKIGCGDKESAKISIDNFTELASQVMKNIGELRFNEIMDSEEFKELYLANLDTFNKVELAQKDNGLAKEVDLCNYNRYLKKKELQKKFFNKEIKEIKIGY